MLTYGKINLLNWDDGKWQKNKTKNMKLICVMDQY